MKFRLEISRQVAKFLDKLPSDYIPKLDKIFSRLAGNPYDTGNLDIKKLRGFDRDYRLRLGKYRFLYTIFKIEGVVLIYKADTRGDIYKK